MWKRQKKPIIRLTADQVKDLAVDHSISLGRIQRKLGLTHDGAIAALEECRRIVDEHPELGIEVIG